MSFFDGRIEIGPEAEQFREVLDRLREEVKDDAGLLRSISDDVFSTIAAEAFDDAERTPLRPQTLDRKAPPKRKRKARRKRGARRKVSRTASNVPFANHNKGGLYAALTDPVEKHGPVAYRVISGDKLEWGTQRWVDYAHPHIDGTRNGLPPRLAMLQPGPFAVEASERTKDVMADWLGSRLEEAGAPTEWIQELTEGHY